eukprot:jgi/Mesvir1/23731/Mv18672-RA.3
MCLDGLCKPITNGCPPGWTYYTEAGCLQMSSTFTTRAISQTDCAYLHAFPAGNVGHLVKIESQTANSGVNAASGALIAWIGLNYIGGTFRWDDDTLATYFRWSALSSTSPTDTGVVFSFGYWYRFNPGASQRAMCQINPICKDSTQCPSDLPACDGYLCRECRDATQCIVGKFCAGNYTCIDDENPPQITCPLNITQGTTEPARPHPTTVYVSATDAESNETLMIECSAFLPDEEQFVEDVGSLNATLGFPVGITYVGCAATDAANNSASCAFTVTVDCDAGVCPPSTFCTRFGCVECRDDGDCEAGLFCKGHMCIDCISNQTGSGASVGCTDATLPYCVAPPPEFVVVAGVDEAGFCVACAQIEGEFDVHPGCTAQQPVCAITHTFASTDAGGGDKSVDVVAVGATGECFACLDDQVGYTADYGCPDNAPYCAIDRNQDGYAKGCSEFPNLACEFEGEGAVLEANAVTCPTDFAVEARIDLTMENCTVIGLNFTSLAAAMSPVLNVSTCALQLDLVSQNSLPPKRRLLQEPGTFSLLAFAFVANEQQGNDLITYLSDVHLATLLAMLELNIGEVLTINVTAAALVRLGSVTSDPHFVTPQGNKFDFNGVAGNTYCIVTDKQLQVNARFVAAAKVATLAINAAGADTLTDARTWMDQVAILHGGDRVLVDAASPAEAPFASSFGTVHINGKPLLGNVASTRLSSGLTVARKKTRVLVLVPGIAAIEVETVRAAFWEAGTGPGRNFLNLQVKELNSTSAAHGILGRAFGRAAVAQIEGNADKYATSGIYATDCVYDQFGRTG